MCISINFHFNFLTILCNVRFISFECILFVTITHSELAVEVSDFLTVRSLSILVPFNASINLGAQLFVYFELVFKFGNQVAIKFKPNVFRDFFPILQTILLHVQLVWSYFDFLLLALG